MSGRILYLDLVGGAAGDMLLAALVDLGASVERIRCAVNSMGLNDVELHFREVYPESLRALQLDVIVRGRLADTMDGQEGRSTLHTGGGYEGVDTSPLESGSNSQFHDQERSESTPRSYTQTALNRSHEGHSHSHVHEGHSHSHVHEGHSHSHVHEGHSHSHGHEEPSHPHGHRPWVVIRDLIDSADLTDRARGFAQDAFQRLAKAESFAHGIPMEQVEFHEVGSDDAIADIVGTAVAIDELNIHTVIASPFPLGRGLSRGAHGALPIPGPATLHILEGAPVLATPLRSETVTPTGAALVRALASHFGPIPSMTLEAIGVGAGHKRWPDRPNIVRAILGSQEENSWLTEQSFNHHYHTAHNNSSKALEPSAGPEQSGDERSRVLQLETNIDDMNPEHLRMLFSELFVAGALDVWATSSMFKKGRLGWVMGVLVPEDQKESVLLMLFKHSSTLGVRWWWTDRQLMSRSIETVVTPYGSIRVKRSQRPGAQDHVKPEHDDVLKAATEHRVPMRVVEEMVLRQVWQQEQA